MDSTKHGGMLVLLGVLFTIILAGLDNTIVSTVIPVALPELGGAHLRTRAHLRLTCSPRRYRCRSGDRDRIAGDATTHLVGIVAFTVRGADSALSRAR